jgi:hypothetical protein
LDNQLPQVLNILLLQEVLVVVEVTITLEALAVEVLVDI